MKVLLWLGFAVGVILFITAIPMLVKYASSKNEKLKKRCFLLCLIQMSFGAALAICCEIVLIILKNRPQ